MPLSKAYSAQVADRIGFSSHQTIKCCLFGNIDIKCLALFKMFGLLHHFYSIFLVSIVNNGHGRPLSHMIFFRGGSNSVMHYFSEKKLTTFLLSPSKHVQVFTVTANAQNTLQHFQGASPLLPLPVGAHENGFTHAMPCTLINNDYR